MGDSLPRVHLLGSSVQSSRGAELDDQRKPELNDGERARTNIGRVVFDENPNNGSVFPRVAP